MQKYRRIAITVRDHIRAHHIAQVSVIQSRERSIKQHKTTNGIICNIV